MERDTGARRTNGLRRMEGIVVDMDVDVMFLYLFNQKMRRMSGGRMKLLFREPR
jgi:hypothetical protein